MAVQPTTGEFRYLEAASLTDAQKLLEPGEVLVQGTEDELAELSRRIKLGAREVDRREARRKMQKASRRRNR